MVITVSARRRPKALLLLPTSLRSLLLNQKMTVSTRIRNLQHLLSFLLSPHLILLLVNAAHPESAALKATSPDPQMRSCSSALILSVKSTFPAPSKQITVPSQRSLVSFSSIRTCSDSSVSPFSHQHRSI